MAIAVMFIAPQQANAQFWKQLGKVAKGVGKAVLESSTSQESPNQSQTTQSIDKNSPRYKIHKTAETKTITLRGGANFMGIFSEGYAIISQKDGVLGNKAWFVINEKGEKVFNLPEDYKPSLCDAYGAYQKVRFNSGRLLIEKREKYATKEVSIIDTQGNIIKTFNNAAAASQFNDGVAVIAFYNGMPWLVDINGNIISKSINLYKDGSYYWVGPIRDDLRYFQDQTTKKYGYLDAKCNIVISPKFKNCESFSEGLALVQNDEGLWGFIDKTGKYVIEPLFTFKPTSFYDGYARVQDKSYQDHYIDKTGKIAWTPKNKGNWPNFSGNGYLVYGGVILNTSFKEVGRYTSDGNLEQYGDKWFAVSGNHGNNIFDYSGNLLLTCLTDMPFCNDIGLFKSSNINERYYYNIKGEIIVEFKDTQF